MCKAPVRTAFELEAQRRTAEGRGSGGGRKAFPSAHASLGAVEGLPGHTPHRPGLPSEPQGFLRPPHSRPVVASSPACPHPPSCYPAALKGGGRRRKRDVETGSEREKEGRSLGSKEEERKGEKEGEMEEGEGREEEE